MNRLVIFGLAGLLFLSGARVQAKEATPSGIRQTRLEERAKKLDEMKAARDEFLEKRAAAKEGWKTVKDEHKVKILERVELNLQHINEQATKHFMSVLARLEKILAKITARAEKLSKTVPEIATAQTAIDTAEAAVTAQAGKTYNLSVTSEASAAGQVRTSMQQLKSDITAVREKIKAAREAVKAAFQALKGATPSEP
jgi:predicted  nucleic acid-binding Zn-ribbon protein